MNCLKVETMRREIIRRTKRGYIKLYKIYFYIIYHITRSRVVYTRIYYEVYAYHTNHNIIITPEHFFIGIITKT